MPSSLLTPQKQIVRRSPVSSAVLPGVHPVLDPLYRNRGVSDPSELDYSLAKLCPPGKLSNLDHAVEIIVEAVQADASILITGDYDADGATSSALGYLVLKAFGARHVAYLCPGRFEFGYGLTEKFVEHIALTEPDLLVTVDNGISSLKGVELAKEHGITVIVTDHHLPGETLPMADAIVNPRLPDDQFPSKNLAGVGVIFYVLSAVRSRLIEEGWFEKEGIGIPNMAGYLDLVALGTIADVVPLDYNNRILVSQGLARINSERCRIGIRVLLESGRRSIGKIVAEDLAFAAGPRLNAAGRLDDISLGIQCLASNDQKEVLKLINKLDELNIKRQMLEKSMVDEAISEVEALEQDLASANASVCLFNSKWHHGIAGLIASRIRERTSRPTIVFTQDDSGCLRGSGRSVRGINLRDVIADVAKQQSDMLVQFGGHAMAAGLTLKEGTLDTFKSLFEKELIQLRKGIPWKDEILTDGEIVSIDFETADLIRTGGPWGQGFEVPVFDGVFDIMEYRILKDEHLKLRVHSQRHSKSIDAIYFRYFHHYSVPPELTTYQLVFRLETNEYRGQKSAQLNVLYMQES